MNIGIYLDSLERINTLSGIDSFIANGLKTKKFKDASVFYDDVNFVTKNLPCGKFNSTDLWNFSGTVIVPYLSSLYKIRNIVNNIYVIYYYGFEDKTPAFNTIEATKIANRIICCNEKSAKYLYRISGLKIDTIRENFDLLESV